MRIRTVAALALGYVIGTRAGRDRYDQILQASRQAVGQLQNERYESVLEVGRQFADRLQRVGEDAAASRRDDAGPGR